jgi:hypothetical protein
MKKILLVLLSVVSLNTLAWVQRPNAAQAQCMVQAQY